ncbi:MAG: ATP-binding cassette domain-containing protein, partial [Bacteroidota bacterium]|nr:ATP-binding cassette domain-containing protein [Bacteroidota bacterium]
MLPQPLLSVNNLSIGFKSNGSIKQVVHSISFNVFENEIVGIVGESGSGKSVTALSLLKLLPKDEKTHISAKIVYKGNDLIQLEDKNIQDLRGREIAMIFQEPMSALNPSMRCGEQVVEILLHHKIVKKKEVRAVVLRLFESVKISDP